jgi:serine/threonine-protein kinase
MSPEQVAAKPIDGRSDLFSAGLILYELVTGEKAYRADSIVALLYKIAHEDPDLSLLPRGAPWERLRGVLARALSRDPDERYPDARSMGDELAAALLDLGGSANWASVSDAGLVVRTQRPRALELGTAAPPLAPPVALGTAPAPEPAPPPATSPGVRSPVPLAVALVLGAVVVLAFVAFPLIRREPAPPPPIPAASPPAASPPAPAAAGPVRPSPTAAAASTRPTPRPGRPSPAGTPAAPGWTVPTRCWRAAATPPRWPRRGRS